MILWEKQNPTEFKPKINEKLYSLCVRISQSKYNYYNYN